MALTSKQINELAIADARRKAGKATSTDIQNLKFAESQGWKSPEPGTTPTRTLEGTLNFPTLTMEQANDPVNWSGGKFVGSPTSQVQIATVPSSERSLGAQKSPLQSYQDILKQMTRFTFDQGQKPTDILQQYSQAGVPLTVPGVIGGAISSDTRSRAAQIGDIYQSTMQTIQEKQKQDAEYTQMIMKGISDQAPTFLTSITPEEFGVLRSGQTWTPEMEQKLQLAQQEYQQSKLVEKTPTSFQEWQLAGGQDGTGSTYGEWLLQKQQGAPINLVKIGGQDYVMDEQGNLTLPQVPTAPTTEKVTQANEITNLIDQLLADKNLGAAVGPISTRLPTLRGGTADFEAKYRNLLAKLTLENLNLLKGPMSDKDIQFIKEASAALNLGMSEAGFKAGLEEIKKKFEAVKEKAGSSSNESISPAEMEELKKSFPGMSEEEIRQQLGFNPAGTDTQTGTGMRTDRHNNPTAFTTDVAKTAGLKEGVDYVKGDTFGGGKYATAKIVGDPIDTTIKVIDRIGFQTSSGKPRWSYIDLPKSEWDVLTYEQKKQIIGHMYRQEGGTQLSQLFG